MAESDKFAAQEVGEADDNLRRRRHEKLKEMLQKLEVCEFVDYTYAVTFFLMPCSKLAMFFEFVGAYGSILKPFFDLPCFPLIIKCDT